MPLVYRVMKKDEDDLPVIEQSASGLGIRPGTDVDVDSQAKVIANGKGMSVAPSWRALPVFRIPKRLRNKAQVLAVPIMCTASAQVPGCSSRALLLLVWNWSLTARGMAVSPQAQTVSLAQYQNDLAATRSDWQIDES